MAPDKIITKSPINTQVWHIQLLRGQLETQQRAGDCSCQSIDGKYWYYTVQQPYLGYLSVSKSPAETAITANYVPNCRARHTQIHSHWELAESPKSTKDRCACIQHVRGVVTAAQWWWRGGKQTKMLRLWMFMGLCVCAGTVRLTLYVMGLDGSLEKPKWFFKDYMEHDVYRKMWLYGSNGCFAPGDACLVRSLCTATCGS